MEKEPDLELDGVEREEAERRSSIRAVVVHEAVRKEGEAELKRPFSSLAWSGFAAGLSMGFSLVTEGLLRSLLPGATWTPLIAKFGYSMGFLIVILGRQQLYTENTLTAFIPFLMCRTWPCLKSVLRLWSIVLICNLAGVFLFAAVIGNTDVFSPGAREAFREIGTKAMEADFPTILVKGIFAGWMIALIAWLMPAADTARIWIIIILTYVVGLGDLSHIIAGSGETFYLVATGVISFPDYLLSYMLPTLIGNTIGGVLLVSALNHAQVVSESRIGE